MDTAGFTQSADGFPTLNCPGATTNWEGTTYSIYQFYSSVPWVTGCSRCGTGLWAGIGGLNVSTFGLSNLIQSGFWMRNNGVAALFVEFTPGSIVSPLPGLPSADTIGRGDQFYMWGWSASQSNCAYTGSFNNTNFGCFGFQDITKNWSYSSTAMEQPRGSSGAGNYFVPTSGEMVVEVVSGFNNASYGNTNEYGGFYDQNEAYHADPGASSATDPYIYTQQNDSSGNALNVATWASGTQYTPRDPATFINQNTN